MNLYFINYRLNELAIPIIANVIANSKEDCLNVLTGHLSNLSNSVFCDDSMLIECHEKKFIKAIEVAQVFALADTDQLSKVVYYDGP